MVDKLSIFNGALVYLGEREIASLTEDRAPVRHLENVWKQKFIDNVLSEGQWVFATRSLRLEADSGIVPAYGYEYAFGLPDDFLNFCSVCSDENGHNPVLRYVIENNHVFTDYDTIYISYISNGTGYGGDFDKWSPQFLDYVICKLAYKACMVISQSNTDRNFMRQESERLRKIALNQDARLKPTKIPAETGWSRSRRGGRGYSGLYHGERY